jgi:hypothetical protein
LKSVSDFQELDDVKATLPAFELRDERLRPRQLTRQVDLSESRSSTGGRQQLP